MKYVTIPNTDLRVSQICLGSAEFGATLTSKDAFGLLDAFVAEGGNFIDTAHVYSDWIPNTKSTSEKFIGEWFRKSGMRDDVMIATKGAHPELASMNVSRLSKADIEQDVNESLEYLQIETIDLYWLHRDDVKIPVGEIIEALNEQVWLGNIRYFGCSNWTFSRMQEALVYAADKNTDNFVANQPLWSLAVADMKAIPDQTLVGMDAEGLAFHKRTRMAVIPYTSQGKGFFSKVERSGSAGLSEGDRKVYFSEINSRRLLRVQELAKKYGVTVNDIALSYLLSQPFTTIPVVGCKTIEQLKSSLKAVDVVLTRDEVMYLENGLIHKACTEWRKQGIVEANLFWLVVGEVILAQPFTLGVNYWPRRKAMYWWSNFDAAEVREEFAIIREIGLNVVRIFLLWDDFQPTPDTVSEERLKDLTTVCDIAAENGLGLDVTFFTGHMSGPNWSPGWLLDESAPIPAKWVQQVVSGGKVVKGGYRNVYHDAVALDAQRLLLRTVVSRLKDHSAIWMWNLGNEPDLFAIPNSHEAGQAWVHEMTQLIKSIDSKHPVTCGLHTASLNDDVGLRVNEVYAETDVAVMHGYPMYAEGWSMSDLDPDFVPYLCALVTALCGKPTLAEEFGGCTAPDGGVSQFWEWESYGRPKKQFMASEQDLADYLRVVLPKLVEVGATGAMTWCFADYISELWDKPPCEEARHERFFGLVRPDGSLKPITQVFKDFAASKPTVQPAKRTVTLDVTPEVYYANPLQHAIRLYREQFLKA